MKVNNFKTDIKSIIIKEGFSIKQIAERLSGMTGENISQQNLNNKINREQLRYIDILMIADILGYEIEWIRKDEQNIPNYHLNKKTISKTVPQADIPLTNQIIEDDEPMLTAENLTDEPEPKTEYELLEEYLGVHKNLYTNDLVRIKSGTMKISTFFNGCCDHGSYSGFKKFMADT